METISVRFTAWSAADLNQAEGRRHRQVSEEKVCAGNCNACKLRELCDDAQKVEYVK